MAKPTRHDADAQVTGWIYDADAMDEWLTDEVLPVLKAMEEDRCLMHWHHPDDAPQDDCPTCQVIPKIDALISEIQGDHSIGIYTYGSDPPAKTPCPRSLMSRSATPCPECANSGVPGMETWVGEDNVTFWKTCPACHGTGEAADVLASQPAKTPCPHCHGCGYEAGHHGLSNRPCKACGGTGEESEG